MPLFILPVIDVSRGVAVRAVAGRRSEYRPLVSRWTASADPLAVARAVREHFGWTHVYLADLDAIAGAEPSLALYERLRADGFRPWVDAGVGDEADAVQVAAAGVEQIIAGLETLAGPAAWQAIVRRLGGDRVVFSLDLRDGRPLSATPAWGNDVRGIVHQAIDSGGRRIIVIDLARVGTGGGTGTEELCAELVRQYPGVDFHVGGGVRGPDDLRRLEAIGVAGVLLASALHDGAIRPGSAGVSPA